MKLILFFVFLFQCLFAFAQKTIELKLRHHQPATPDTGITGASFFELVIINRTDTMASFYENWNTWGQDALVVELTLHDSVFLLHRGSCDPNKNFPSGFALFPGDSIKMTYFRIIKCAPRNCPCFFSQHGVRFPDSNLKGGKIRAIYQVNLENHTSLTEGYADFPGNLHPFSYLLKPVSHKKRFSKIPLAHRVRSFVKDKLYSPPVELTVDSW